MTKSLNVRQVLFPEDYPNMELAPIQAPVKLNIGPTPLSRIGRKLLGLKPNASGMVNSKHHVVFFASGGGSEPLETPISLLKPDLDELLAVADAGIGATVESYRFHLPETGRISRPYHLEVQLHPGC